MEKVRPWCGQPSDRGRLRNRTEQIWAETLGLCPFGGGRAVSPSSTMWPGPRPISMPSGILIHPAVGATINMGRKLGALPPFGEGNWVPHLTQCCLAEA